MLTAPLSQEPLRPAPATLAPVLSEPLVSETQPALRIDGAEIGWGEFARWLVRYTGESRAREYALESYVVEREAQRRQVSLPPEAAREAVDAILQERIDNAFFGRKDEWLAELARTDRTMLGVRAEFEDRAHLELLCKAMLSPDRVVPEHKIVREWELAYGRHGKRYDLRMLFQKVVVPTPERMDRAKFDAAVAQAKAEGLARAQALRERILKGEDFETLAARESQDPTTKSRRGQMPGGFRDPGWPWNFLDAIEALPLNQVSEPLYAKGGYWLVKVLRVEETPLAKVRREIELKLLERGPEPDEVGMLQERLRENVKVEVLPAMWGERPNSERPDLADPVIAVDGEPVTKAMFGRWMARRLGEAHTNTFAESFLVHKRAEQLGIVATAAEAEQRARDYIDELVRDSKGGTREAWLEYLGRGGRDPNTLLREWTFRSQTDVLVEKMIIAERQVSPEAVKLRFEELYGKTGERLQARVIAIPVVLDAVDDNWTREELDAKVEEAAQRARVRAEELQAKIRAGEDFAVVARRESADMSSRDAGGLIAGRFREDRYTPEIYAAAQSGAVGEALGPFRQSNAWYLIQVVERRKVTLAEVQDEIREELRTRRPSVPEVLAYRNGLRQKAKIEVLPGLSQ